MLNFNMQSKNNLKTVIARSGGGVGGAGGRETQLFSFD